MKPFEKMLKSVFRLYILTGLLCHFNISAKDTEKEIKAKSEIEAKKLPACEYIDPEEDLARWDAMDSSKCHIEHYQPPAESSVESERYAAGERRFSYNAYVSDLIGARRNLSHVQTHERCANASFDVGNLRANVIIIYHNEAFSVLVRMVNSILAETPAKILRQIILYDDFSEEKVRVDELLREYAALQAKKRVDGAKNAANEADWESKVKIHRAEKREGLIRAKVFASRIIEDSNKNDILIYLDSHCEVTKGWIEPLLAPINEDRTRVVLPVVDLIDPFKFEYSKAMVAKGSFNWALKFKWEYFEWSYFDDPQNYVRTFKTISPSGGLIAIGLDFFRKIGEYDTGMEIWGAENVELAVRVWLCGGSILTAPCSRVGHVFRTRRPYTGKAGVDTNLYNALRTVNVWFDEYKEQFFNMRPQARKLDAGDLSERLALKESLKCHPFRWFLENVHPEIKPYEPKAKKKTQKVKTEL